jgi:hypothetical protein
MAASVSGSKVADTTTGLSGDSSSLIIAPKKIARINLVPDVFQNICLAVGEDNVRLSLEFLKIVYDS